MRRADANTSKKNLSTEMKRNVSHGAKQIIGGLNRQPTKNPPRKAFTWQEIVDRSRRKGETKVCCDNLNIFHTQCFPAAGAQVHCGGHSARLSFKRRLSEDFTITEKAPTRAFWLKVLTSAFTFKTLLRLNGKRALTQR